MRETVYTESRTELTIKMDSWRRGKKWRGRAVQQENKQHKSQRECVCGGGVIGKVIHSTVHRCTGGPLFTIHSAVIERCMGRLRLSGADL